MLDAAPGYSAHYPEHTTPAGLRCRWSLCGSPATREESPGHCPDGCPAAPVPYQCFAALAGAYRCPLPHGHDGDHLPGPTPVVAAECPTDPDRCPVCGDLPDYCQGHGDLGDPNGAELLRRHDGGDHVWCADSGGQAHRSRAAEITHGQARRIAADWHSGQTSALCALATSGYVDHTELDTEITAELSRVERLLAGLPARDDNRVAQRELAALQAYVASRADGPWRILDQGCRWSDLWDDTPV